MGQFEIYKGNDKQWYWRLIAKNGQIVAVAGEGYKRRDGVLKSIQRLPGLVDTTKIVEVVE